MSSGEMKGKVVLITGATEGIGKATAEALARMGAQVVIVGRNPEKTERVVQALRQATGSSTIEYLLADLSLQSQVRALAEHFKARYDRLDVLINNAGAIFSTREETAEGFERTWATNHLSYFLLTSLLLDLLKKSAPARIINVASDAHRASTLRADTQWTKGFWSFGAYGHSKLCNILFTRALARRLVGTGVTVNALHPGVVASGFGRSERGVIDLFYRLGTLFMLSPEQGARTSIYLASALEVADKSGLYWARCKVKRPNRGAEDDNAAEKLWALSLKQTGLSPEEA